MIKYLLFKSQRFFYNEENPPSTYSMCRWYDIRFHMDNVNLQTVNYNANEK